MTQTELRAVKHLVANAYLYLDKDEFGFEIRDYNFDMPKGQEYFVAVNELTRETVEISLDSVNLETDMFYELNVLEPPEDLTLWLEIGKESKVSG